MLDIAFYMKFDELLPQIQNGNFSKQEIYEMLEDIRSSKPVVYNIETLIGTDGKPYIMELTPRGGGNRLCEMLRYATGVDMITAITRTVVGDPLLKPIKQKSYNGHWAEIILHADHDGVFERLEIDKALPATIIESDLWVKPGDKVERFLGANTAIGTLVLRFNSAEDLGRCLKDQRRWLRVIVD